jgi:hypothetical protein
MRTIGKGTFDLSLILWICNESDRKEFASNSDLVVDEATVLPNFVGQRVGCYWRSACK